MITNITPTEIKQTFPFAFYFISGFCVFDITVPCHYQILSKKRLKIRVAFMGTFFFKKGKIHRDKDKPAIEFIDGSKWFYKHGKKHRSQDRPAIEKYNGTKIWYNNGKLHRDHDQPAICYSSGTREYWYNGKLHRINGPATYYHYNNNVDDYIREEWWKHGKRHRENEPAYINFIRYRDDEHNDFVMTLSKTEWWNDGNLHCLKGPAVTKGDEIKKYFIHGEELVQKVFERRMKCVEIFSRKLKEKYKKKVEKFLSKCFCKNLTNNIANFLYIFYQR